MTWLNLLNNSRSLFVCFCRFLEFFCIDYDVLCKWDNFISSFVIHTSLIFFCYRIVLASTSNTMLNNTVWSRHFCLVSDLRVEAFSLSPSILSIMLFVFVDALYQVEETAFYFYFSRILKIMNKCRIVSYTFPESIDIIVWLFFVSL